MTDNVRDFTVRRGDGTGDHILGHWCRVERESDAAPLADVFTVRQV